MKDAIENRRIRSLELGLYRSPVEFSYRRPPGRRRAGCAGL